MADKIAYWDWTSEVDSVRYRVTVTPRGTSNLSSASAPAFGAGASGNYLQLPDGCVIEPFTIPEVGYDKHPVGLPDGATMKQSFNLTALESGSADHQAFMSQLLDPQYVFAYPTYESTGSPVGPSINLFGGGFWRKIPTGNVISLYCDDGSGDAVASFRLVFRGVQQQATETTHTVPPWPLPWVIEIEWVSIFWTMANMITPEDVRYKMSANTPTERQLLHDVPWGVGSQRFSRVLGTKPGSSNVEVYRMFKFSDLWSAVQDLLQQAYRKLMRDSSAVFDIAFVGGGTGAEYGPYVYSKQYRQSYTAAGGSSTSPAVAKIVGEVVMSLDPTTVIGGYLHDDGSNDSTLFKYETIYLWLKDCVEQCVAVGRIRHTSQRDMKLVYIGLEETATTDAFDLPIEPGDFEGVAWKITTSAVVVTEVTAEIPGTQSGDVEEVEAVTGGVAKGEARECPVVFHNCPAVGQSSDHWYQQVNLGAGAVHLIGTLPSAYNVLYYEETIAGITTSTAAVRMHHRTDLSDGATFHADVVDAIALPSPGGTVTEANYKTEIWDPLRLAMLRMQREAGFPLASCVRTLAAFSSTKQAMYEATVRAKIGALEYLGLRAGASFGSGEDLTGRAALADVPGRPHLMTTSSDTKTGAATIKLLARGE